MVLATMPIHVKHHNVPASKLPRTARSVLGQDRMSTRPVKDLLKNRGCSRQSRRAT